MAGEPAGAKTEPPEKPQWWRRPLVRIGGVVGVLILAIVAALGNGMGQSLWNAISGNSSPASSPASPRITISPLPTYVVSRRKGFVAKGTVSDLDADTIWLFDHRDDSYYIDVQAIVRPDGRHWSAPDRLLGSETEKKPFNVEAVVVVATPRCASILQTKVSTGDTRLPILPPGCKVIKPPITVTVNKE